MAQSIRDVMTQQLVVLDADSTAGEAARQMAEHQVGDVLVQDAGALVGIVTDRDLAVRALADDREGDPRGRRLRDCYSRDLVTVSADASVEEVARLMSERAVRRIPVMDGGEVVGIVSLGDLAVEREPESALGQISAAPPDA
jgi:CBS domain-containing protein